MNLFFIKCSYSTHNDKVQIDFERKIIKIFYFSELESQAMPDKIDCY